MLPMAPLTWAELAAALAAVGGFERCPRIAVAVSGGPDSMALALLVAGWARERDGEVQALTVDHGLRAESGAEAGTVAGWLAARGIAHQTLVWEGAKPQSGIQARAREARYRLLAQWCRDNGVLHLLTAHHREDQIETHLIRRRARSGIDGLAGMSAVRELPGCRLVRPLLAVPRARLLAVLAEAGQPCLSDPSNLDPFFERARLRAAVAGNPALDEVFAELRACGRQRVAREREFSELLGRAVALHPAGFAVLDRGALAAASGASGEFLLGRVALCIGGGGFPPRRERVRRLWTEFVARPSDARTLGGCRFVPWRDHVLVLRELAAASAPVPLKPGLPIIWDGRFTLTPSPGLPAGAVFGHLGQSGARIPRVADRGDGLPRLVRPVLPAFWDADGLLSVPHLGYRRGAYVLPPRPIFSPRNGLSRADFTVV